MPEQTMYDPFLNDWIPYEPKRAAEISLLTGELAIHTDMSAQQILDTYGDSLSDEQINELKSRL